MKLIRVFTASIAFLALASGGQCQTANHVNPAVSVLDSWAYHVDPGMIKIVELPKFESLPVMPSTTPTTYKVDISGKVSTVTGTAQSVTPDYADNVWTAHLTTADIKHDPGISPTQQAYLDGYTAGVQAGMEAALKAQQSPVTSSSSSMTNEEILRMLAIDSQPLAEEREEERLIASLKPGDGYEVGFNRKSRHWEKTKMSALDRKRAAWIDNYRP